MGITDQKQRVATERDVTASWGGVKNGKRFYCYMCGHQFEVGDKYRWVYAGSVACSNLLVCEKCDGDDVLERWGERWKEWEELSKGKFRFVADMLESAQDEADHLGYTG